MTYSKHRSLLIATLLAVFLSSITVPSLAFASSIETLGQPSSMYCSWDMYGSGMTPQGDSLIIGGQAIPAGWAQYLSALKFDIPGSVQVAGAGSISAAKLLLCVSQLESSPVTAYIYGSPDDAWSSAPGGRAPSPMGDVITTVGLTVPGWIEVDVTEFVRNQVTDGQATFVFDSTGFWYKVSSPVAVAAPRLDITYAGLTRGISASAPPAGTYRAGDNLDFRVSFSDTVTVAGTPYISLTLDSSPVFAYYVNGSGTSDLTFRYTVQAGDLDVDGIAVASPIQPDVGSIRDTDMDEVDYSFTMPSTAGVKVDAVTPEVVSVSVPANGTYAAGSTLSFGVRFSEPVQVSTASGTPRFSLFVGDQVMDAIYLEKADPSTLVFRYLVQEDDFDGDGISLGGGIVLGGGTIKDLAGNDADITLAGILPTAGILVDGTIPTVTDVTYPASGDYRAGASLNFAVVYDKPVIVDTSGGAPSLAIRIGDQDKSAAYIGHPAADTLSFGYTVAPGDLAPGGIILRNSVTLGGAVIRDTAGNNISLGLLGETPLPGVVVDAVAPEVDSVTAPADGSYRAGQTLSFGVTFSEAVAVNTASGSPYILLNVGGTTRQAVYSGKSSAETLTFTYTVQDGDTDTNGVSLLGGIVLDGGTISDLSNNSAVLALNSVSSTVGVCVDTSSPTVSQVLIPAAGTYGKDSTLDFTVRFTELVEVSTVSGTPSVGLTVGDTVVEAPYLAGSGSTNLTFRYTVGTGQLDSDGVVLSDGIVLNGGTIKDSAGNDAGLALANIPSTAGLKVDATAPVVTGVDCPADGRYGFEAHVDFAVNFDKPVTVDTGGGTPYIGVEAGTQAGQASFASGSGTASLVFTYVVQGADVDTDGIELGTSIVVGGGSIKDAMGNDAAINLANVGPTAGILVDGAPPEVDDDNPATIYNKDTHTLVVKITETGGIATGLGQSAVDVSHFRVQNGGAEHYLTTGQSTAVITDESTVTVTIGGTDIAAVEAFPSKEITSVSVLAEGLIDGAGNLADSDLDNVVTAYVAPPLDDEDDFEDEVGPALDVVVNHGSGENAFRAAEDTQDGQTVITVTVAPGALSTVVNNTLTVDVNSESDAVVGVLNGQMVSDMESAETVLQVQDERMSMSLPAGQIGISSVARELGAENDLEEITVAVRMADNPEAGKIIQDAAERDHYTVVVPPVNFAVTCTYRGRTVEVGKFTSYVERTIAIPDGVDPSKITTGVVLNADGTLTHVPTVITVIDGKYYAKINSLTNSDYSLIYSPRTFVDMEGHWAEQDVTDLASRLVVNGEGEGDFEPDRGVTRAEFAAMLVRSLGIMRPDQGTASFRDVQKADWYYDAVGIAGTWGLVGGYEDGTFRPDCGITREEAMAMVARAIELIGFIPNGDGQADALSGFADAEELQEWARAFAKTCVNAGVVKGDGGRLNPAAGITRAESAAMVRRMLTAGGLI